MCIRDRLLPVGWTARLTLLLSSTVFYYNELKNLIRPLDGQTFVLWAYEQPSLHLTILVLFSVAWEEELLAGMSSTVPNVLPAHQLHLPPFTKSEVLLYEFSNYRFTEWSNTNYANTFPPSS